MDKSGYSRHKDKTIVFIGIFDHLWIITNICMVCMFASRSLIQFVQYTIPQPAAMKGLLSLADFYPRVYRPQHSPNYVDVGLLE